MNKSLAALLSLAFSVLFVSNQAFAQEIIDSISNPTLNQKIKSETFNNGLIVEPLQLIQGIAPGVSISKKGSDPSVFNSISFRGTSSGYSSGVLYVIDGVIGANPNMISPEDIESFEILKDAVSVARYGSRGMDGVVVIKTKRNKTDKRLSIDFNSYLSLNQTSKRMDLLSANEFRSFIEKNELNFEDGGGNTDWQDEIFRNTVAQNYSIAVHGKLNNTGYRVSLNHQNNPGIVLGSNRSNTGLSLNVNQSAFNNRLNLNFLSSVSIPKGNNIPNYNGRDRSNIFYQAFTRNPTDPVYEPDGVTYAQSLRTFQYNNPLPIIEYIKNTYSTRNMNLGLGADYRIFKGLEINVNAGYSFYDTQTSIAEDLYLAYYEYNENDQSFTDEIIDKETLNLESALKYNTSLSDKHNIEVQAVFQHHSVSYEEKLSYQDLPESELYITSGSRYFHQSTKINSLIGKIGYNFKNRYFISAIANNEFYKHQGEVYMISGVNYTDNKGNPFRTNSLFYGINLGWSLHNESFLRDITFINKLELIGSYGIFGNTYPYQFVYFSNTQDINNLNVEKTEEFTLGLNFGLLKNRINGSIVYYDRKLKDGILQFSVPVPPNQYPFVYKNGLVIKNRGFEFTLNTTPFENEKIKWTSDLYFHSNNNIFPNEGLNSSLHSATEFFYYYGINYPIKIIQEGSPSQSFYLPVYAGQTDDGSILYYNSEGNLTSYYANAKKESTGQIVPKFELGWTNSIRLTNGFDFSFALQYVAGHSIFNATRMRLSDPNFLPSNNIIHEGVENYDQQLSSLRPSSLHLEDASYIRLQYLILGYTLKSDVISQFGSIRIYVGANNLFTFTKYKGLDPAYGTGNGIDYFNVYPLARSFVFGLKLSI